MRTPGADKLEDAIMAAHARDDRAQLSSLYLQAGDLKIAGGDIDAACFFFTQAYVYGLDSGNEKASTAARRHLVQHAREK